jgi:tRNA (adenine37-N6)-methyltransferase
VFATHAPFRPNLIALTQCKVLGVEGSTITVDTIDAFDGTPILDLKCW